MTRQAPMLRIKLLAPILLLLVWAGVICASLDNSSHNTFQIIGLRHTKQDGVVACLGSLFDDLQPAMSIDCRLSDNSKKHLLRHVVGTRASDEHATKV